MEIDAAIQDKRAVNLISAQATPQQCDEVCTDVIPIISKPFPKIESGTRYVVDGTLFNGMIPDVTDILLVRNVVNCAKIAVPSGSGLRGMSAQSRVRLPREMLRRGARRSTATTRR